jgi:hypothetical protein
MKAILSLTLAGAYALTSIPAAAQAPASGSESDGCPFVSALPGSPPTCFAEMGAVIANPRQFCDKRIVAFGYLDTEDMLIHPHRETAEGGFMFSAVPILGTDVATAVKSTIAKNTRGAYVTLIGTFRCQPSTEVGITSFIGEIIDVEEITTNHGRRRQTAERVLYRAATTADDASANPRAP